ncbi:MAG: hypothetical protein HKN10_05760 [Myxococcales bacterium]|nr:hypothetical protein [Deltaproteobacteria bacterium]NNE17968.1 hypothetical protein [Myxococcales bacterium]
MTYLWKRSGIVAGIAIIAVLSLLCGRVAFEARGELAAARAYRQDDRPDRAIEHYRRSIRWDLPLSPYQAEAVSELQSLANELEAEGNTDLALLAWRSLSGGIAATRTLYSGSQPVREKANDQIARLLATDRSAAVDARLSVEQLAADHRRLLSDQVSPDPFWGLMLMFGMAVWVGALLLLARSGFDSAGRFHWATARGPVWGALLGFVSFALGLLFA